MGVVKAAAMPPIKQNYYENVIVTQQIYKVI